MKQRLLTHRHDLRRMRSRTAKIALVLLAGILMFALTGCKDTLRLTEIIYDQEVETVDYDNPTKVLVQDPNAEETSDQLPLIEQTEDDPEEETPEDPDFGEDETDQEIANVVFGTTQGTAQYASTEGGTGVAESGATTEEKEEGGGEEAEMSEGGAGQETEGENSANSGGGGDVEATDESGGDTGSEGDTESGTEGARSGGNQTYYSETGEYSEPPPGIDYVAAVGEAATIVSMLAGDQGALLYTDAAWASRANLSNVLGNKYNDEVVVAWSEDGNDYDLSEEMLTTMIDDERLELVFITSEEETLRDDQQQRLEDAGIVVQVLPDLKTATKIKQAVAYVGRVFAAGDNVNVNAERLASDYVNFHDQILSDAAAHANTSLDESNMQSGLPVQSSNENMYTVYVSDWADDVYYVGNDKVEGGLDTSNGIGIVELGYQWSPLSYYLSVGGAINTASQSIETSGTSLLWQFSLGHITALASDFSRSNLVSSYYTGDTPYHQVYLTSAYLRTSTSSDGFGTGEMRGAGTRYFPYVIVNNQASKAKLEADRDSPTNSLYKIYNRESFGSGSIYVGPAATAGNAPLFSTAGLTGQQTSLGDNTSLYDPLSGGYDVVTNPYGMFESWTEGTIESVLETAWISGLYRDGGDPYQDVYDFYRTFYDYSLSSDEYQMIINGEVG